MKNLLQSACLVSALALVGCATAPSKTFYPAGVYATWHFEPKAVPGDVLVLRSLPPESGFGILGELAIAGGPKNSFQEMLDIAQKEAAAKGADFIVLAGQQVQTRQETVPGFASHQSTSNAAVSVNGASGYGVAQSQGTGFAVGPSVREVQTGSMNVVFGKYPKVWLGLQMEPNRKDGKAVIAGFTFDSPAPKAGVQVGDELIAIDGRDIRDPQIAKSLYFTAKAGDPVRVAVRRGTDQKEFSMAYVDRFAKAN